MGVEQLRHEIHSLKLTPSLHLNKGGKGRQSRFLLGAIWPIFRDEIAVSFRQGICNEW